MASILLVILYDCSVVICSMVILLTGQLDGALLTPMRSEATDSSSSSSTQLKKKKPKSLTPINQDKYSTPTPTTEYNTQTTKWHWHPASQNNHPKPLGSINGTKRNSWTNTNNVTTFTEDKTPVRNQQHR